MTAQYLVEQKFGITVDIQRRFIQWIFGIHRPRAVDSGRRGVDQGNLVCLAMLEQFQRYPVIVVQHIVSVTLGGIGTGALMEYGFDISDLPFGYALPEVILMQVIGNFSVDHVKELVAFSQIVDHKNIGITAQVQAAHNIAADETGTSGHNNRDSSPAVTI